MNILPKKRWHVRTKENIARVRRDEAEAAEKEKEEKQRIENADREARLNILKQKSQQKLLELGIDSTPIQSNEEKLEHINFFTDIDHAVKQTNKEHDNELKEKKEEYEKKIGYLTYLGQDTNEALKKKNWYEVTPKDRFSQEASIKDTYEKLVLKDEEGKAKKRELDIKDGELDWKTKQRNDPLNKFKKYCAGNSKLKTISKSSKDDKKHSETSKQNKNQSKSEKETKLQKLREARLKREQQEKYRTELFLSGLNASTEKETETDEKKIKPKYNSQFNPELARQNYR